MKQAHDGQAGDALAAAALSHDAQHLALVHIKADAAHRLYLAYVGAKRRSLDFEPKVNVLTYRKLTFSAAGPESPAVRR